MTKDVVQMIFFAMQRNSNMIIYYNRKQQCVQQDVKGYFLNHNASDKNLENEILSKRISIGDKKDIALHGVHFLIPRLELKKLLMIFSFVAAQHFDDVQEFLDIFHKKIRYETEKSGLTSPIYVDSKLLNRLDAEFKEYCIKNEMVGEMYDQGYKFLIDRLVNETVRDFLNGLTY